MSARGLIVSAPRSSSGKTLSRSACSARCGGKASRCAPRSPDRTTSIPAFHAAATGAKGVNLDCWAMPPSLIDALIADTTQSAEVLVIEGAMGLFDGVPGTPGRSGAASDLAARLSLPVLLILDVSGQSQSAAAVAAGFASYNPAVRVGGVVLNKLGSDRHRTLIADALKPLGIAVLGAIPRDETLVLPERHLGLVQASEHADLAARLERFAEVAARHLDLDAILAMAAPLDRLERSGRDVEAAGAADRAGFGRGVFVCLCACARWLAAGRRGNRAVLAAARRSAGTRLRCLLAARRLSRTACGEACGGASTFSTACQSLHRAIRCTASVAATWCWARPSRTPRAFAM